MRIRVKDALKLYNARMVILNRKLEREDHYNTLNSQRLGMMIYKKSQYGSIAVSMNRMNSGAAKTFRVEWVEKMCDILGVDANFLFGFKSKHDKEFNKLFILVDDPYSPIPKNAKEIDENFHKAMNKRKKQ